LPACWDARRRGGDGDRDQDVSAGKGFTTTEDLVNHVAGGILMGFGGVTALGCTIGQGLSGVSTLALGSFLAVGAIVVGCVAALKYQMWRLDNQ
jgi:uncharacterized membrane protein YedE/YeeE